MIAERHMVLAFGILLLVITLPEVRISSDNSTLLAGIYVVMAGAIWGMLILRNH